MKRLLALFLVFIFALTAFAACNTEKETSATQEQKTESSAATEDQTAAPTEAPTNQAPSESAATEDPDLSLPIDPAITVKVGAMTGPTGIGMIKMMEDFKDSDVYDFTVKTAADQLTPMLLQGKLDAAAVPANLAAVLYNKSEGKIRVAAINTLGVLSILERGESINTLADLKGKTIYMLSTAKGSVPEYTLRYLLTQNGVDPDKDVTYVWKSQEEIIAALKSDKGVGGIALLPQPAATAATVQVSDLRKAIDLGEAWDALGTSAQSVTGVLVVRADFAEEHPTAYAKLLADYEASINYVKANVEEVAPLAEKYIGIKTAIAKKAIPSCALAYIDGNEMKETLSAYLEVLYAQDAKAVGGKLPDSAFYLTNDNKD